jgi:TonB family protein
MCEEAASLTPMSAVRRFLKPSGIAMLDSPHCAPQLVMESEWRISMKRNYSYGAHALPFPRGIAITPLLKNSLKWGLASLLVSSIIFVAAGNPNDATSQEEETDDGDEPVYSLAEGITPPRVTKQVKPQYSPGSRRIRLEGSVLIETVVSSRGTPKKTHVVRGLDKDVDEAAVAAVKKWVFEPGGEGRQAGCRNGAD